MALAYHRPQPGPLYWDWRCLVCSRPVLVHASWIARVRMRRVVRRRLVRSGR